MNWTEEHTAAFGRLLSDEEVEKYFENYPEDCTETRKALEELFWSSWVVAVEKGGTVRWIAHPEITPEEASVLMAIQNQTEPIGSA